MLLGDKVGREFGVDWLRDLSRRNGFPPIVYLMARPSPETEEVAIHAGAQACLSRNKVDHGVLVAALRAALARRGQFCTARGARRRVRARRRASATPRSAASAT